MMKHKIKLINCHPFETAEAFIDAVLGFYMEERASQDV
jgi:hypothetical protein